MKKQDTLFTDDDGNKIYEGDTIEWSYMAHGFKHKCGFLECYPGEESEPRKRIQVMKFEKISDTTSGYKLNRPQEYWTASDIKCKKIK